MGKKKEVKELENKIAEYLDNKEKIKTLEKPIKSILKTINKIKKEQKELVSVIKEQVRKGIVSNDYTVEITKIDVDAYSYDKVVIQAVDKEAERLLKRTINKEKLKKILNVA